MRCENCQKFVGIEERDPEINSVEVDDEGHISVEASFVNECAECSSDLRSAEFTLEADCQAAGEHIKEIHEASDGEADSEHELSAEDDGGSRTCRQGYYAEGKFIPKGGRYGKTFYGVEVVVTVSCSCGKFTEDVTLSDEVQASGMDEC